MKLLDFVDNEKTRGSLEGEKGQYTGSLPWLEAPPFWRAFRGPKSYCWMNQDVERRQSSLSINRIARCARLHNEDVRAIESTKG
jgi:hypothetical protein